MTDKELKKLNRAELLEILLAQTKEFEELKSQFERLKKKSKDRQIAINEAGSIAEAALKLNGVFEAAQRAANQYLENIKGYPENISFLPEESAETKLKAKNLLLETQEKCKAMEEETQKKCKAMIARAKKYSEKYWTDALQKVAQMNETREDLKDLFTQIESKPTKTSVVTERADTVNKPRRQAVENKSDVFTRIDFLNDKDKK